MSFHKCFYCERKLEGVAQEIDHFIEVAERRDLAYDWDNLYLACDNSNNKLPNRTISTTDALDPCRDTDEIIEECLTFEKGSIQAKSGSQKGLRTIQKYKLDSEQLDHVRTRQLQLFYEVLIEIQKRMIVEQRQSMSEQEKEALLSFKNPEKPFSLMFKILLEKYPNLTA